MLGINRIGELEKIHTPFWYYDTDLLRKTVAKVSSLAAESSIEVHYAIKANAQERLLRIISSSGIGADCVSGNEVLHAVKCGFAPEKIVFAGVGKTDKEIADALEADIFAFNCESLQELYVLDAMASRLSTKARVSVRINPNIDANTHKFVTTGLNDSKFGIGTHEFDALADLLGRCRHVEFNGLHFHLGSQITDIERVYGLECKKVNEIVSYFENKGISVHNIDLGGGLGVEYENPDEYPVPDFGLWFRTISRHLARRPGQRVHVEPGRSLVAQCGTLFSRVLFVKSGETKTFLIVDAGMNDMIRPALYGAYHRIENLSARRRPNLREEQLYDVVGPVCESSDVWGTGRVLPMSVRGDLIAIRSAGAYGQTMSSRYNLKDFAQVVYSDNLYSARLADEY